MSLSQKITYFAYGSNLDIQRLGDRTDSFHVLGIAILEGYRFSFHKKGVDGTGKADAFFTGKKDDLVYGGLFEISPSDKERLDKIEIGYKFTDITVKDDSGEIIQAQTYLARPEYFNEELVPTRSYLDCILRGASYFDFPAEYIEQIKALAKV